MYKTESTNVHRCSFNVYVEQILIVSRVSCGVMRFISGNIL